MSQERFIRNLTLTTEFTDRSFRIAEATYLFFTFDGNDQPLTGLEISHNDDDGTLAEQGYSKLPTDLNPKGTQRVYLWWKRGEGSPLLDARVFCDELYPFAGHRKNPKALNAGLKGKKQHLTTLTAEDFVRHAERNWVIGERIDAKDTSNSWLLARILKIKEDGSEFYINYCGWAAKWDEWIPKNSPRLAPLGYQTGCRWTGQDRRPPFNLEESLDKFHEVLTGLKNVEKNITEAKDNVWPANDVEFLTRGDNLEFVVNILGSDVENEALLPEVLDFLQTNLRIIIRALALPKPPAVLLDVLKAIFGSNFIDQRFYMMQGVTGKEKPGAGKHAKRPAQEKDKPMVSQHLVDNVEYFGDKGGLDALVKRLLNNTEEKSDKSDGFDVLGRLVSVFACIRHLLGPKMVKIVNWKKLCATCLHRISDEELKSFETAQFTGLVQDAKLLLLASGLKDKEVDEFHEKLQLELALRLLSADVLRKRLDAMTSIDAMIKGVQFAANPALAKKEQDRLDEESRSNTTNTSWFSRFRSGGGASEAASTVPKVKSLTPEGLSKWILEKKLVETLLSKSSHEQLVKMSPNVMKFLAQNQALTNDHINLLWQTGVQGHDSLKRIVYDALADLAEELNEKQLDALYARISGLPLKDYRDFNLNFLKNFTINSAKAANGSKWYGTDKFWEIIQDENAKLLEKDVVSLAFVCFVNLMAQKHFESQRTVYLERCVKNLKEKKSVVNSLRVAREIIALSEAPEKVIAKLDKDYKILDLLIQDTTHYADLAKKASGGDKKAKVETKTAASAASDASLAAQSTNAGAEAKNSPVLVGIHNHNHQLQTRLSFVEFLVANSKLTLQKNHINDLWSAFVTNAISSNDTAILLNWLILSAQTKTPSKESKAKSYETLSLEMTDFIFTDLLSKVSPTQVTATWFNAFRLYFMELNFRAKATSTGNPDWFTVLDSKKLVGVDALWTFASNGSGDNALSAARLLTSVHIRNDAATKLEEKRVIYKNFITACVERLNKGYKEYKENDSNYLRNVVVVLSMFLQRMENGEGSKRPLFVPGERVTAYWRTQRTKKYFAKIEEINSDGTYHVKYDDGDVDPVAPESNLFGPDEKKKDPPKPSEEDDFFPKTLLASSKEYFDLFFNLLGLGGEVADKVWFLLRFIPSNKEMEEKFQNLVKTESVDWKTLLPSSSVTKLLYILQVVKSCLHIPRAPGAPPASQAWGEMFVTKGGLSHLYEFIIKTPTSDLLKGVLPQQCTANVLEIFSYFLSGDVEGTGVEQKKVLALMDVSTFVKRVLDLLAASVTLRFQDDRGARMLCEMLFSTLARVAFRDDSQLATIAKFDKWSLIISEGLLVNPNTFFRHALRDGFAMFTGTAQVAGFAGTKNPRAVLLPIMLARLPEMDTSSPCDDFLASLSDMIDQTTDRAEITVDVEKLGKSLTVLLRDHPWLEVTEAERDLVLSFLFKLTTCLARKIPELANILGGSGSGESKDERSFLRLTTDALFEIPHNARKVPPTVADGSIPPKAKHPETRAAAFFTLNALCSGNPQNTMFVYDQVKHLNYYSHSGKFDPNGAGDFWPMERSKGRQTYVGLRNLGCICYMNASMQQLFMIPKLRENILAINSYTEEDGRKDQICQLQYVMSHLQESERMYVDPKPFTDIWMDESGKKPINVGKQEDASAFVIRLIDRIGELTKNLPEHKDCVRSVLGGLFEHQIIGLGECGHNKVSRDEEYFTIPVEVQNKKNMYESLKAFVEGETVEGFNCELCKKKVNVQRRSVVKTLPPTLIITLKRFVLNFTTFMTDKLDERIEFPMELDMFPYTADALPIGSMARAAAEGKGDGKDAGGGSGDSASSPAAAAADTPGADAAAPPAPDAEKKDPNYYKYFLRGVVIHSGTAHSGHYFSYIQERLVPSDPSKPLTAGKWFEFNDTNVSSFDPADIPDQCFGISSKGKRGFGSGNGYLLFYDRADTTVAPVSPAAAVAAVEGGDAVASPVVPVEKPQEKQVVASKVAPKIVYRAARVPVPPVHFQNIWLRNLIDFRDASVCCDPYYEFVWQLIINSPKDEPGAKTTAEVDLNVPFNAKDAICRHALRFFFQTATRVARNRRESLPNFHREIEARLVDNLASCTWFLNALLNNDTRWLAVMAENNDLKVIECSASLIRVAIATVLKVESERKALSAPPGAGQVESKEVTSLVVRDGVDIYVEPSEYKEVRYNPERGYAVSVIDALVQLMNAAGRNGNFTTAYLDLISSIAQLGEDERKYLGQANMVVRLVDFYLMGQGKWTHINNLLDRNGKRGATSLPPFILDRVLALLNTIVLAQPILSLPKDSLDAVTFSPFIVSMVYDLTGTYRLNLIEPILEQILLAHPKAQAHVLQNLADELKKRTHEHMRPFFRALGAFMRFKSEPGVISSEVMTLINNVALENKIHYKETDFVIAFFIRFGKHFPAAKEWIVANEGKWNWMVEWLQAHPKPTEDLQPKKFCESEVAIHVEKRLPFTATSPYCYFDIPAADKIAALEAFRGNKEPDMTGFAYDSDDERQSRVLTTGDEIDALDTDGSWLPSVVKDTRPGEALVHYEGWSEKWDEFLKANSTRITKRGKLSAHNPPKKKKK